MTRDKQNGGATKPNKSLSTTISGLERPHLNQEEKKAQSSNSTQLYYKIFVKIRLRLMGYCQDQHHLHSHFLKKHALPKHSDPALDSPPGLERKLINAILKPWHPELPNSVYSAGGAPMARV